MLQTGRIAVSLVVCGLWGMITLGYAPSQSEANQKLIDVLMQGVVFYWIGGSAGSDRKTEIMGGAKG